MQAERLLAPLPPRGSREIPQIQPQTVNHQPTASGSGIQPLTPPPPSSASPDFGNDEVAFLKWADNKVKSKTALNEKEIRILKVLAKTFDDRE